MRPSPICDAYSGGCETPAPVPSATTAVPRTPELPTTGGVTNGDVVLGAAGVVLLGAVVLALGVRRKRS